MACGDSNSGTEAAGLVQDCASQVVGQEGDTNEDPRPAPGKCPIRLPEVRQSPQPRHARKPIDWRGGLEPAQARVPGAGTTLPLRAAWVWSGLYWSRETRPGLAPKLLILCYFLLYVVTRDRQKIFFSGLETTTGFP
jgi:hypothetical protein